MFNLVLHSCRDRKRKKFVGESGSDKQKRIKTESGHLIRASYKSSAYRDWRDRHKIETPLTGLEVEDSVEGVSMTTTAKLSKFKRSRFKNGSNSAGKKSGRNSKMAAVGDLKSKAEILKKRSIKQAQEKRRKMKRKAAAMKNQSSKRQKGRMR